MQNRESQIIFIVGGARSGKSSYGEQLAQRFTSKRIYIATAEIIDEEMELRVAHHKKRREGLFEATVEEPIELGKAIEGQDERSLLFVDCLSVYLGNLFYHFQGATSFEQLEDLYRVLEQKKRTIILISNEVGEGIVPASELSRAYRDAHGWMNQRVASIADVVIKMTCGIPQCIKGNII
jgi:adenosylcobinamide kinase/adenosylcobinamide-phosphate guanylyltransferase